MQGRGVKVGDLVLRENEVSHNEPRGRLGTTLERLYKVVTTYHNGAYELETIEGCAIPCTWHIQDLNKFFI